MSRALAKLTLVLGLDERDTYVLAVNGDTGSNLSQGRQHRPPRKGKVAEVVQWVMSTLREDQLLFKATAPLFGCIPDCREPSLDLDSTVLTEFEGFAMESDVLSAGDLRQDTDHSEMENSYVSATEADMEMDA